MKNLAFKPEIVFSETNFCKFTNAGSRWFTFDFVQNGNSCFKTKYLATF